MMNQQRGNFFRKIVLTQLSCDAIPCKGQF